MDEIRDYEEAHRPPVDLKPPVDPETPPTGGGNTEPSKPVTPPVQQRNARTYPLVTWQVREPIRLKMNRILISSWQR